MVTARSTLLFLCVVVSGVSSALPNGWSVCKRSSADYENCLKKEINKALVSLAKGNKEMGVLPSDPLVFETMVLEQKPGPIMLSMKLENVIFEGLSTAKVTSVKNDWKKMTVHFNVPSSRISGKYSGKGNVLFLPLNGNGDFSIDWVNMDVKSDLIFKEITKNGKRYFQVQNIATVLSPQNVVIRLDNLFNGNKPLGDTMNKFLNDNWREILKGSMAAISQSLEEGTRTYINSVLSQIPANEIDIK